VNQVSFDKYKNSGFYKATNIATLQEQLAQYAVDDATLRQQAQALYQPTYDATKLSYQNQLAELMTGQESQLRQINQSYDKGLNTLNNNLLKRGLGRSSLVATQGVAMENQRAQAIGDKTSEYLAQQRSISSQIQQLDASYAQQIEARINELRTQNQTAATQLQLQIAELQYNGYLAYMANQKKSSGGGSSKSSGSKISVTNPGGDVDDYNIGADALVNPARKAAHQKDMAAQAKARADAKIYSDLKNMAASR
jgi:hypothetical protein